MTLKNCVKCGKLFLYVSRSVCQDCINKEEEDYNTVKQYLKEHPGAMVDEIGEATGVEENLILRFLRDGRLISVKSAMLECLSCGAPIFTGTLCEKCAQEVSHDIEVVHRETHAAEYEKVKEREKNKWRTDGDRIMFTAHRNKK